MNRRLSIVVYLMFAAVVLSVVMFATLSPSVQLQFALGSYDRLRTGEIPEDLTLTIYYISPDILTRYPLGVEDLVEFTDVNVITVTSDQLEGHLPELSGLELAKTPSYINARLYYVLETENRKVVEVVTSAVGGNVFVNGIEVEHYDVFYDFILPFLSAEDREILGL